MDYLQLNLPSDKDFKVATMTIIAKIVGMKNNDMIDITYLYEHSILKMDGIRYIELGSLRKTVDPKFIKKINSKKNKKKSFHNQTSSYVIINNRNINIKIFKAGTIHITGCNSIDDFNTTKSIVLENIICVFYYKFIVNMLLNPLLNIEPLIDDIFNLDIKNIQICMINTYFDIGYTISRKKLHTLLTSKIVEEYPNINIFSMYESLNYAGVKIKVNVGMDNASVSIFNSGKIMIIGCTDSVICETFKIIKHILTNYKSSLIKLC